MIGWLVGYEYLIPSSVIKFSGKMFINRFFYTQTKTHTQKSAISKLIITRYLLLKSYIIKYTNCFIILHLQLQKGHIQIYWCQTFGNREFSNQRRWHHSLLLHIIDLQSTLRQIWTRLVHRLKRRTSQFSFWLQTCVN